MERSLQDMNEKLDMLLSRSNVRCASAALGDVMEHEADERIDGLDRKLNMIAEAVGVRVRAKEEEDAEDRKRLKERLKEALALEKTHRLRSIDQDEKEGWVEYFFGIVQPNGRVGKMGSRYARPRPAGMAAARRLTDARRASRAGLSTRSRASCKVKEPAAMLPLGIFHAAVR